MIEKHVTIINKLGLHARAAAKLISTTGKFSSQIRINKESWKLTLSQVSQWKKARCLFALMIDVSKRH